MAGPALDIERAHVTHVEDARRDADPLRVGDDDAPVAEREMKALQDDVGSRGNESAVPVLDRPISNRHPRGSRSDPDGPQTAGTIEVEPLKIERHVIGFDDHRTGDESQVCLEHVESRLRDGDGAGDRNSGRLGRGGKGRREKNHE
jgi:hypothetical protein